MICIIALATLLACIALNDLNLPTKIKDKLLIHDASHNSAGQLRKGFEENIDPSLTPGAKHPIIFKDPSTQKKSLFLGRRPHAYIVGMTIDESDKLLNELWAHATQKKYTFTHRWQNNEVLMWKNLFVLHKRDSFNSNTRRVMHRTQISGDLRIS